jgi:cytochrome c-type biogenesis protein CcmH/NrfG
MKKETVILMVVIALLVGFTVGATVGILYMINREGKEVERDATVQKPQMAPQGAPVGVPAPGPSDRDSIEVTSKIQTLKEIVKKDLKNLAAWVELGNLYFDSDQPEEAIDAYSQYLAMKPDNADIRTDMGIMFRSLGQFDRAIEEFRKAAQSDPKHADSRYNIGIVLLHDKRDMKGAIKAWEEYLKVEPQGERADRVRTQMENLKKMAK